MVFPSIAKPTISAIFRFLIFDAMEGWLSWSKAPDSKSGVAAMLPWVRIPPLPVQK
jgi:hypothetical protein